MATFLPTHCSTALMIRQMGGSDLQIAAALQCELIDVHRWKAQYPQFAEACRVGGQMANERVKDALYHRATGYNYQTVRHDKIKVDGVVEIVETEYMTHVPPDIGAIKYWLENEDEGNWSSVVRKEITGKDGAPLAETNMTLDMEDMTDEELEALGRFVERKTAESTGD